MINHIHPICHTTTGNGAIYIFNGSPSGPSSTPSQIIDASTHHWGQNLHHFGWSVSTSPSGIDVDGDGYPEVGVGAFGSDAAIVLKTKPVVDVKLEVNLEQETVEMNETRCVVGGGLYSGDGGGEEGEGGGGGGGDNLVPCVGVEFCFEYSGLSVPEEIRLDVEWKVSRFETKPDMQLQWQMQVQM